MTAPTDPAAEVEGMTKPDGVSRLMNGQQYSFDAGHSELIVFDGADGSVSITLQSNARGHDDYHMSQASGSLSPEVQAQLLRRLAAAPPDLEARMSRALDEQASAVIDGVRYARIDHAQLAIAAVIRGQQ